MALIAAPEEATLLAREMVADIERYNDSAISSGRVPREAIREGRALFRARVVPELDPLFEQALGNTALAPEAEPLPSLTGDAPVTDQALERAGLPTRLRLNAPQRKKLLSAMQLDKKVCGGEVKFVLARRIGAVEFGQRVPMAAIERSLNPQPSTLSP